MGVTKESVRLVITPEMDDRAASKAIKSATDLYKKISKMKVEFAGVAKASNVTLKEISGITAAAGKFSKALSDGAKTANKELQGLGDQLSAAHAEAAALGKAAKGAKGGKAQAAVGAAQEKQVKVIQGLNKDIDVWRKNNKAYGAEVKKVVKSQQDYQRTLKQAAKFGAKDMMKGVGAGVGKLLSGKKSGLGDIASALGKGAKSATGKGGMAAAPGGKMMAGMAGAVKAMGVAASAVSVLVQLIAKATAHMSQLNKAMLQGATFAGDSNMSAQQYAQTMKDLRNAAIDASGNMLAFGVNSEKSLGMVAAFSKEASGSLGQTSVMLKQMGGSNLGAGLQNFAKMATVYGQALGMQGEEVATMMGTFVSEVGYGAESAQAAMQGIVKDAAAANMPVHKFMDIFRQTVPSLDQYTNRMEELTGVIKLLSKTMSAKDVKKFMEAFGSGFEQVDFKQRLKMALVGGVGKISGILKKDFANAGKALEKQFDTVGLGKQFAAALSAGDPVKAMQKVVGKGMAAGMNEGAIGAAQKLARSKRLLNRGGATNVAGAMRGAGMMARYKIVKASAGALTGGNIEGLGEHIAKKISGMSEKQYAAILQMTDNMGAWNSQLLEVGRTSSASMNKNMLDLLKGQDSLAGGTIETEEQMEAHLKLLAKNPGAVEDMIEQAAMMQIESDEAVGEPMENFAKAQVEATLSIGDKIENVLGFLLEKLYWIMDDMLGWLSSDLWGWITGDDDKKDMDKHMNSLLSEFKEGHKDDAAAIHAHQESIRGLKSLNQSGASTEEIMKKNQDLLAYLSDSPKLVGEMKKQGTISEKMAELLAVPEAQRGQSWTGQMGVETSKMDSQKALSMLGTAASQKADWESTGAGSKVKRKGIGRGTSSDEAGSFNMPATSAELAAAKTDYDPRTLQKYKDLDSGIKKAGAPDVDFQGREITPAGPAAAGPAGPAFNMEADAASGGFNMEDAHGVTVGDHEKGLKETAKEDKENTGEIVEQDKAASKAADETGKEQLAKTTDVYDGIKDVAGILKKGIRFEKTFLTGAYSDMMKDAVLESTRTSLLEHAVILIRAQEGESLSEFGQGVANSAWDVIRSGPSMQNLSTATDQASVIRKSREAREQRSGHQAGGSIHQTGDYTLHKGEAVLDAMTYESVKRGLRGGQSQGSVVMNITINGSDLTEQQLRSAVAAVADDMARRH